jgi:hypothetical protein
LLNHDSGTAPALVVQPLLEHTMSLAVLSIRPATASSAPGAFCANHWTCAAVIGVASRRCAGEGPELAPYHTGESFFKVAQLQPSKSTDASIDPFETCPALERLRVGPDVLPPDKYSAPATQITTAKSASSTFALRDVVGS